MCPHILNIDLLNKCVNLYKSIPVWVFTSILCFCLTVSMCTNIAQHHLSKEQNVAIEELLVMNDDLVDRLDKTLVVADRYRYGFVFINTALGIPLEQAEVGLNKILENRDKNK